MNNLPLGFFILFPSFIMDLGHDALSRLWTHLSEVDEKVPKMEPGDTNIDLIDACLVSMPLGQAWELLIHLSLVTASLRGNCLLAEGEANEAEHVVNLLGADGADSIAELCFRAEVDGQRQYVYDFAGVIMEVDGQMCGYPPEEIPDELYVIKTIDYFGSGAHFLRSGIAVMVHKTKMGWGTELFLPNEQRYIVYAPGLTAQLANSLLEEFCAASQAMDKKIARYDEENLDAFLSHIRAGMGNSSLSYQDIPNYVEGLNKSDKEYLLEACERYKADHLQSKIVVIADERRKGKRSPRMVPVSPTPTSFSGHCGEIDPERLTDMVLLRGGLSMPRFEWNMVHQAFPPSCFTPTGRCAPYVIDVEHPGEWCTVLPGGKKYCNCQRERDVRSFELANDAEFITLSEEMFARVTLRHLVGLDEDEKIDQWPGVYGVVRDQIRICLSLAESEDVLTQQIMRLWEGSATGKTVIITAFLAQERVKGIIPLRDIFDPDNYRDATVSGPGIYAFSREAKAILDDKARVANLSRSSINTMVKERLIDVIGLGIPGVKHEALYEKDKKELVDLVYEHRALISEAAKDARENSFLSVELAVLRGHEQRWALVEDNVVSPAEIITGLSIPRAPLGASWKDLNIELSVDPSGVFVQFRSWFKGKDSGEKIAPSKTVKLQLLDGFSVKGKPQEYSAAAKHLINLAKKEEETRKRGEEIMDGGRQAPAKSRKLALSNADRDARRDMKQILATTFGLSSKEDIFDRETGRPVFSLRYKKSKTGKSEVSKNGDAQGFHDRELENSATTEFDFDDIDSRNGWEDMEG